MVTQHSAYIHPLWMRSQPSGKILILSIASIVMPAYHGKRARLVDPFHSPGMLSDYFHLHRVHSCKHLCIALSDEVCIC